MIIPIPKSGLITFPATFVFKGKIFNANNVLLDTGASNIILNEDAVAPTLLFTPKDIKQVGTMNTGNGTISTKIYQLDSAEAMGYKQDMPMVRVYAFQGEASKYDAIIGLSFFRTLKSHFCLDFGNKELYLPA